MKKSKPKINKLPKYEAGGLGWMQFAQQGEQLGQSMVQKDEYGNPVNSTNQAASEIITPDHKQMINSLKQGQYGTAILNSTGLGKFARMGSEIFGHQDDKTGGWGKFNKLVGTPQYNEEGVNTNTNSGFLQRSGQSNNNFAMGGFKYPNGGVSDGNPNSSIEQEEITIDPNDGTTYKSNSGTHESGNDDDINMKPGTMILSDRLKPKGSKLTFAALGKPYQTNKEEKVISDNKASDLSKSTAELNMQLKQRKLDEIFATQEQMKHAKVASYAKKLGIELPQIPQDNESQEPSNMSEQSEGEYANGGIHNGNSYFKNGGIMEGEHDVNNFSYNHILDLKKRGYDVEYI